MVRIPVVWSVYFPAERANSRVSTKTSVEQFLAILTAKALYCGSQKGFPGYSTGISENWENPIWIFTVLFPTYRIACPNP